MAKLSTYITLDKNSTLEDLFDVTPGLSILHIVPTYYRAIFQNMAKLTGTNKPDFVTGTNAALLDSLFFGKYGKRRISPIILKVYNANKDIDIEEFDYPVAQLCNLIANHYFRLYYQKWNKLYATLNFDYDPIANVDASITDTEIRDLTNTRDLTDKSTGSGTMADTGTDTTKHAGTDNLAHTGTDTTTNTGTDEITHSGNDTVKNTGTQEVKGSGTDTTVHNGTDTTKTDKSTYGFNSETASPTDSDTATDTKNLTDTETRDLTDTTTNDLIEETIRNTSDKETRDLTEALERNTNDNRTLDTEDATTYGKTNTETRDFTDAHTGTVKDAGTVTHTITRKGNIGVTMTQQMIEAERKVWTWFLYDVVFKDMLSILASPIY